MMRATDVGTFRDISEAECSNAWSGTEREDCLELVDGRAGARLASVALPGRAPDHLPCP